MALSVDSIIKLSTPQKAGILVLTAALVIGAYWYGVHAPQIREIEAKESKLKDLIMERNRKRAIAKDLPKFKAELRRMNEDLKGALSKLPDKKEIPSLLKSISNLGKEAGLEILLFKPQGEEPGQFYARVPVELKFVGSYHRIGVFFYHVGTLSRVVNIEKFSINRQEKKSGEDLSLRASCIATTYRYLEEASKPEQKGKKKRKR